MGLEVDYITLGDASSRLNVPAPTLRHWTDQMEEFNVHFVLRNNRNERIYESSDIKVFEFLRDLKEEYGRRTTTRDLGYMILDKGKKGELVLRTRDDVPIQNPSNRTTDLLNQEDIKKVLESDRARQVLGFLVNEATQKLKDDLIEEVRISVREELEHEQMFLKQLEEKRIERELEREKKEEEHRKYVEERAQWREERDRQARIEWEEKQEAQMNELKEMLAKSQQQEDEKPKSFMQRLFGK